MTTNVLEMPRNALKGAPGALLTEPGDVAPYARDWLGNGVMLRAGIVDGLRRYAERLQVALPNRIAELSRART